MLLLLNAGVTQSTKMIFGERGWGGCLFNNITFWGFQGGRLFKVGVYSKIGAYLNKYGNL